MRRRIRKSAVVVVTLLAATSLAACQAGREAQTSQDYDPADGRNVNIPEGATDRPYIAVRNAVVVAAEDEASLVVTLVNQSDEAEVLESATLDEAEVTLSGGPVELEPNQSVSIGYEDFETATVSGFEAAPGDWVDLTLRFATVGDAELQVLVVPYGDEYVPVQFAEGPEVIPTSLPY
jgi:hypothetical protein